MSLKDQPTLRIVLNAGQGPQALAAEERYRAVAALLDRGYAVTCATGEGGVAPLDRSAVLVLGRLGGRSPAGGVEGAGGVEVQFKEVEGLGPAELVELVEQVRTQRQAVRPGEWKPWFPVIDYDRCTHCMQCLSFCLFGVYGVDARHHIQVQNNDQCKTNCPACSRVCPEAAIMFPKYKAGPINGDVVSDTDLQREKMKVDISALLGGDVYQMLRERSDRSKSRFSKERDADKALAERRKCLVSLAQMADVPPEVLMALPSPEEIQRRAEEAKARALAALTAPASS